MRKLCPVLLLLLAIPAAADDLTISGDGVKVIKVDKTVIVKVDQTVVASFPFRISAPPGAAIYFWSVPAGVTYDDAGAYIEVSAAPQGMLAVSVKMIIVDFEKKIFVTKFGKTSVAIGDPGPTPPGPTPPGPTPPGPSPIPINGLAVLMVYDSSTKLPAAQQAILTGKVVRDYLDAKCPKQPDGKTAYRIWDKAEPNVSGDAKVWQDAFARPRTAVPWIIISNGKSGFEGPMPASVPEAMKLLQQFGG